MKKLFTLSALLFAGFSFAQTSQNEIAMKYAETITIEDLKEDLTILASDALEGRETGKRGQKMAAAYIKAHFEDLGLVGPVKVGDPYYQDVPLTVSEPGEIYLTVGDKKLANLEDMYFYGDPMNTDEVSNEVVFVGAGTEEDFKSVDVKGKSALIINYDSGQRGEAMKLALKYGAELIFIVRLESDEKFNTLVKRYSNYFSKGSMGLDAGTEKTRASAFYISPLTSGEIFGKTFDELTKAIADKKNGKKKALKKIKSGTVKYSVKFDIQKIVSENVLGFLEGSDLKDEVLVLTAHYDHLGVGSDGQIYNGADDDGSGTVAVMDIAEAFVKAKADGNGPRRSILFMLVTGEEKGLLGSEYYADNAIFPLENTVADLNIDMIGRIDDRELESQNYV
ncbi:MAG: M28 family peptidase, partial [Urechidicola sp.]|nr:M28 family peptidase [Urechidicola sp.]